MLAIIGGSDGGSILDKPISISVAKALKIPSITVLKGVRLLYYMIVNPLLLFLHLEK